MFSFLKQVGIVLLSFSSFLARVPKVSEQTKCLSVNNEACFIRLTFTDLNLVKLKYYPFMISLNKCTRSWMSYLQKIYFWKEKKYLNVKAFNMATNKNEALTMSKHTSCGCKC